MLWGNTGKDTGDEQAVRFEDGIEVKELTWQALKQVALKPRVCLVLHLEGYSHKEIAMFMGLKEKSVGTYLSTAREQFLQTYHRLKTT